MKIKIKKIENGMLPAYETIGSVGEDWKPLWRRKMQRIDRYSGINEKG